MMFKPFEEAAYKLKQGEISDVVQSDSGYHIIQLTNIKPAYVKPLDEVKAEIIAELMSQKISKKYSEMAEMFKDTVFSQSDSLKPVAEKLKLKIETVDGLTREPNQGLPPTAAYNNPQFLKALFSNDVIKDKHNTDAIEVSPTTLIAGRIVEYKPATKRPLSEVQAAIRNRVAQEEAIKLAQKAGSDKYSALKTKPDASGFSDTKTISRAKSGDINNNAFVALMKADVTQLPAIVGVELPGEGYGIYRITKVTTPVADKEKTAADQQRVDSYMAQQEMYSYVEALKQKSKIKILKPVAELPAQADGQ
jgi:peptidyl-prolyl cis-trans isomerase D